MYKLLQCINGWAGNGFICAEDPDQDGLPTVSQSCTEYTCNRDNCVDIPNSGQEDNDGDRIGELTIVSSIAVHEGFKLYFGV